MQHSWDNLRYCSSPGERVRLLHLFPYTHLWLKIIHGRAGSVLSGECPSLSIVRDPRDTFYVCVSLWWKLLRWFAKAKLEPLTVSWTAHLIYTFFFLWGTRCVREKTGPFSSFKQDLVGKYAQVIIQTRHLISYFITKKRLMKSLGCLWVSRIANWVFTVGNTYGLWGGRKEFIKSCLVQHSIWFTFRQRKGQFYQQGSIECL